MILRLVAGGLGAHDRQPANGIGATQSLGGHPAPKKQAQRAGELLRGGDKRGGHDSPSIPPQSPQRCRSGWGSMKHLYRTVGALLLLAMLAPALVKLFAAAVPLLVIAGLVVVVVRLVWSYTNRY